MAQLRNLFPMDRNIDIEVWESLGEQDADWAVETREDRKHGGWSEDLEAFYATGRVRVEQALALVPGVRHGKALDWGAGTGRLSFTLAKTFERVTCVDVSTSMQAILRARAAERSITNLDIVHVDNFVGDASYDFGLSLITMQHFSSREMVEDALRAMVDALKPGGWLIVEIPESPHNLRYRMQPRLQVYRVLRRLGVNPKVLHERGFSGIRMLCIPRDWVKSTLSSAGADVTQVTEYRGTSHQLLWYVAEKRR